MHGFDFLLFDELPQLDAGVISIHDGHVTVHQDQLILTTARPGRCDFAQGLPSVECFITS